MYSAVFMVLYPNTEWVTFCGVLIFPDHLPCRRDAQCDAGIMSCVLHASPVSHHVCHMHHQCHIASITLCVLWVGETVRKYKCLGKCNLFGPESVRNILITSLAQNMLGIIYIF